MLSSTVNGMAKKAQPIGQTKPRIGRPRASANETDQPVAEEILAVARRLFREKGFAGTSTREIADAAGLRQPSLFHYFKNKKEIFRAVVTDTVEPVITFIRTEAERDDPADVALYRLVRHDTYHLCTNENVLGSPFQFPELTEESHPEFWGMRDQITDAYRHHLREGEKHGVFVFNNLEIVTQLLFSLGESTLAWYQKDRDRFDPHQVADTTADLGLRAVLTHPRRVSTIRRQSGAF